MLAPDSTNNNNELLHLIMKGRTLRQNISASNIQCHKVMIAFKTMVRQGMKSCL